MLYIKIEDIKNIIRAEQIFHTGILPVKTLQTATEYDWRLNGTTTATVQWRN